jgi:prepilin-type N-terminal cleavage/methylation domain-containing protein
MKEKRIFGFTLIEVLVALSILSIGLIFILQVFPLALNIELDNKLRTKGAFLASQKIEEILSLNYDDITIGTTTENLTFAGENFSRITRINYVDENLSEISQDKGLKKIEVSVSWKGGIFLNEKGVKLITLFAKK